MRMTDEEIRIASLEKLKEERRAGAAVTETTPREISPAIQAFATSISDVPARIVTVVDDDNGRYGWCNEGVALKVKADGGSPLNGWTIWEWAPALLTAEFHCVWQSPTDELFDITPKPQGEANIVFVADPAYPADFDWQFRPRNRRTRLYQAEQRGPRVSEILAKLSPSQRLYEEERAAKKGVSLENWLSRKVPVDTLPQVIDDLIVACDEFEEHFDSLGMSGMVSVDRKLVELGRRRVAIQSHLQTLLRQYS